MNIILPSVVVVVGGSVTFSGDLVTESVFEDHVANGGYSVVVVTSVAGLSASVTGLTVSFSVTVSSIVVSLIDSVVSTIGSVVEILSFSVAASVVKNVVSGCSVVSTTFSVVITFSVVNIFSVVVVGGMVVVEVVVANSIGSSVDTCVVFMYVIETNCGLVKRGLELVDCGKIVIFNLGGMGKGFLVDGRFDGNLYGGFLVVFRTTGFVGFGLKVD